MVYFKAGQVSLVHSVTPEALLLVSSEDATATATATATAGQLNSETVNGP